MQKYIYKENIRGFQHWLFNVQYIAGFICHIFIILVFCVLMFINMDVALKATIFFFFIFELVFFGFFIWHVSVYKIRISEKSLIIKRPGFWWATIYISLAVIKKIEVFNVENFSAMDMSDLVFLAPIWGNWNKRTAIIKKGTAIKLFTEAKEYIVSTNHPDQLKSVLESLCQNGF